MASNILPSADKVSSDLKEEATISSVNDVASGPTSNATQNNNGTSSQRNMWQIFTDESGEVQRKSVKIHENPFNDQMTHHHNPFNTETEQSPNLKDEPLPNGFSNPNAYDTNPPAKPKRYTMENGRPGSTMANTGSRPGSTRVDAREDIVVFESDTTYTRFDNVDDHEYEVELNAGDTVETRRSEKKFLIRSESDLDLVLPPANNPGLWLRLQWFFSGYGRWPKRVVYLKALAVTIGMCVSYALIVLIVVKALG